MEDERLYELVRQRFYAEAFEGLLDRYQNRVFRLAFSFTRDRGRAEELTQDTFLKISRALPGSTAGRPSRRGSMQLRATPVFPPCDTTLAAGCGRAMRPTSPPPGR
jgi:hypothetical protein